MFYRVKIINLWLRRATLAVSLLLLTSLLFTAAVSAIARGYNTSDQGLQAGMVVALSLDDTSSSAVERATQSSSDRIVGVATAVDSSLVAVGSSTSKVFVESEGEIDGYISDIGGKVQKGDPLVLSPLKGVLMKEITGTAATTIAIAADNPGIASAYSYTVDGKTLTTEIAKTKLNLNHIGTQNGGATISDSPLARIGRSIVGKEVGEVRVLIAMIIFVIVLIAESSILYGAISSAVSALGRNPLARKVIRGELLRVIIVALMVLVVGLGAVYGILWV